MVQPAFIEFCQLPGTEVKCDTALSELPMYPEPRDGFLSVVNIRLMSQGGYAGMVGGGGELHREGLERHCR